MGIKGQIIAKPHSWSLKSLQMLSTVRRCKHEFMLDYLSDPPPLAIMIMTNILQHTFVKQKFQTREYRHCSITVLGSYEQTFLF